ncbi:MAG: WD40 repeat domain-containing protein [Labilithrix sp.]|nr:WD40 repeat domain-containing protein [Labilithrix sp.]MBX3217903.1 WD40 repeat domain-containing protein [Labilithrix sp.]
MRLTRALALSDDGLLVLVGKHDTRATLLDRSGAEPKTLAGKRIGAASMVALLGDGTLALHARVLFDRAGKPLTKAVFGYRSAFAARGELVIAVEDETLRRMDRDGEVVQTVVLPQVAERLAVAADVDACVVGLRAILDESEGDAVGRITIFEGERAKTVNVLDEYEVNSVAMSRDGSRIAAGGYIASDGPVGGIRLFRRGVMEDVVLPFAPPTSGNGIAFSSNGARIAAIVDGNLVRITDLDDTARFWELSVGDKGVWCIRAHDGRIEGNGKHGVTGTAASGVLADALG